MTTIDSSVRADLTRGGRLIAALNHGNTVLVQRDSANGEPRGVAPDLARELASRLAVELEFVHFDSARKVFETVDAGIWDVAFLAIDPLRAAGISFTAPYVIIEGSYLVPDDSPLRTIEDVDRAGVRVAAGRGTAYDLYLTRELKQAQLVRAPNSADALELFVEQGLEAAAGVRQPLVAFAASHPGLRVIEGSFTKIEQAMGTALARAAGAAYLGVFIEEMKATGFIAAALRASNQHDAVVAAPASAR
ncbi:MAG: transporter substrate-binding protein [Gammaproteobacteria bacterium]|nr:transporter substrate-binding protein [Gammaproteobacteria bacterium]